MVSTLHKCAGNSDKVCNRFLPAAEKDPCPLCNACKGKGCSADNHCADCCNWSDEM